jgi:GNAT superfamily N-acetyltransferase
VVFLAPAERENVAAMAALLEEMDRFYGATETGPLDLRARQISEAVFNEPPAAHVLLAWDDTRLVGIAAYSFLWPAVGLTRSLFLKELYVAREYWRTGVGRLLMKGLFQVATKQECSRVEWMTDLDNPDAQQFYAALGFPQHPSKLFYRVQGQELLRVTHDDA